MILLRWIVLAGGNENIIKNWFGYSVDVMAVPDGIISSIKDDFSESLTLSEHPEYSPDKATENYISIKIGDEQSAFYEHLEPNSLKVKRHKKITIIYLNEYWEPQEWEMEDNLSELLQHEYDQLDGILCTMRAIDSKSFK